jgi:competence protein ComEC
MTLKQAAAWIRARPFLLLIFVLVCVDGILGITYIRHRPHDLTVAFLDIGQGDAVYIEAPNGNQMLYDAGPPTGAVLQKLGEVMPFYDRSIDVAVFSHPDMDHIGGFVDVFDKYAVDLSLEPGASSTNGVYGEAEQKIAMHHIPHILARKGMTIDMGDGVFADILYPDHDMTNVETNSASIVMRIRYGSTAFIVSGDLPKAEEEYVVAQYGSSMHAQVLKLGHHGSHTSSSESWLRAIHPDIAVISAGLNNRYGHPHKEVLELLNILNIPYLVTFKEGTIIFESDGEKVIRM